MEPNLILEEQIPSPLTLFSWGKGISDLRLFNDTPETFEEAQKRLTPLYGTRPGGPFKLPYLSREGALKSIDLTIEAAPPGVIFVAHPLRRELAKWLTLLKAKGFHPVMKGCTANYVMGDPKTKRASPSYKPQPWEDAKGYGSWEHALFYVKEPVRKLSFDFSKFAESVNGDTLGSLWQINYGGRPKARDFNWPKGHKFHAEGTGRFNPVSLPNYSRLSKNCGVAMGYGLPECGPALDEEFLTIAAQDLDKKFPKDYSVFLEVGGLRFAHNLPKLVEKAGANAVCPHNLDAF